MILRVQCYSGRKADERPVRFQLGDREYVVEEVLDQWYGPDSTFYKSAPTTADGSVTAYSYSYTGAPLHTRQP